MLDALLGVGGVADRREQEADARLNLSGCALEGRQRLGVGSRLASREPTPRRCRPSSAQPLRLRRASASCSRRSATPPTPRRASSMPDEFVSVRYMVDDVENAVAFY